MASLPMCTLGVGARDCSSDWRSVLTAMNSTPSTPASIMRLTALTPAPPTPTTRSTGSVQSPGGWPRSRSGSGLAPARARGCSPGCRRNTARRRSSGVGALRDVRAGVCGRDGSGAAHGGLRTALLLGLGPERSSRRGRLRLAAPGLVLAGCCSSLLLGLAEELGQRALPHARPLTACHSRGPPPLADGRRRPPCRQGRT